MASPFVAQVGRGNRRDGSTGITRSRFAPEGSDYESAVRYRPRMCSRIAASHIVWGRFSAPARIAAATGGATTSPACLDWDVLDPRHGYVAGKPCNRPFSAGVSRSWSASRSQVRVEAVRHQDASSAERGSRRWVCGCCGCGPGGRRPARAAASVVTGTGGCRPLLGMWTGPYRLATRNVRLRRAAVPKSVASTVSTLTDSQPLAFSSAAMSSKRYSAAGTCSATTPPQVGQHQRPAGRSPQQGRCARQSIAPARTPSRIRTRYRTR